MSTAPIKQQQLETIIAKLAPRGYTERSAAELAYPPRSLAAEALVTRAAPSPSGFVHIGTIYMAMINKRLAKQTHGIYMLRVEDTDKKREVAGGVELIIKALEYFDLIPDEGLGKGGAYGPYVQSERSELYLGYAIDLLRRGRAYPCFATPEELQALNERQRAAKVRPGYYGEYTLWRDVSPESITSKLANNIPFVLRFRSSGNHKERFSFSDQLKGNITLPKNDLDVPLIKSDGLPTYHLAHVVDDFLMRTSLVLRGDEWLPSVPLHIELAEALELPPFNYAHFAPLTVRDGGGKRKLSKRKDPEADIAHWIDSGYPSEAILEYLTTLASSDFEQWRQSHPQEPLGQFPITLQKLAMSRAPLLDNDKLDDISRNLISRMDQSKFEHEAIEWTKRYDAPLHKILIADKAYSSQVLSIERSGDKPRKDLSRWDQIRQSYFYFFDELFDAEAADHKPVLDHASPDSWQVARQAFLQSYDPSDDQDKWLQKFRQSAQTAGFAPDSAAFKSQPDNFKGSFADFAMMIRYSLTKRTKTPDLYALLQILGPARITARLST